MNPDDLCHSEADDGQSKNLLNLLCGINLQRQDVETAEQKQLRVKEEMRKHSQWLHSKACR